MDTGVRREVLTGLLDKLVARGAWTDAIATAQSAIFVDATTFGTHALYGRALAQSGAHKDAVFEYESALLSASTDVERTEAKPPLFSNDTSPRKTATPLV